MKLFGTDGVRGKPGVYPLTPDIIEKIGYFSAKTTGAKNILLGKDTRESSDNIELSLLAGLKKAGCRVIRLGIITTPGVSYLTRDKADLGIVITASHNPYYENGIKFFLRDGEKLSDEVGKRIEAAIENRTQSLRTKGQNGRVEDGRFLVGDYKKFLKGVVKTSLSGLRVVVDCANGSGYEIFPDVLSSLGVDVIPFGNSPNGKNINKKCGSLYPEEASRLVVSSYANLGLCLDGDGDRLIAIDEKGDIKDGDFTLGIFASYFKERGILENNIVVGTKMANMGLEAYLKALDIRLIRADVGDRWVYNEMEKSKATLGGEPSGHIIFSKYLKTGDGILTGLLLMEVIKEKGALSSLKRFNPYPSITINVKVREKPDISNIPFLSMAIKEAETLLSPFGRIFIRYSGTEDYIRIMVEGKDNNLIKEIGDRLSMIVKKSIGAINKV